jgi:hypothetical protein
MHFVLSQGCAQHSSVFAAFLLFLVFALFFSEAKELNARTPARANKNAFFISLKF